MLLHAYTYKEGCMGLIGMVAAGVAVAILASLVISIGVEIFNAMALMVKGCLGIGMFLFGVFVAFVAIGYFMF